MTYDPDLDVPFTTAYDLSVRTPARSRAKAKAPEPEPVPEPREPGCDTALQAVATQASQACRHVAAFLHLVGEEWAPYYDRATALAAEYEDLRRQIEAHEDSGRRSA